MRQNRSISPDRLSHTEERQEGDTHSQVQGIYRDPVRAAAPGLAPSMGGGGRSLSTMGRGKGKTHLNSGKPRKKPQKFKQRRRKERKKVSSPGEFPFLQLA